MVPWIHCYKFYVLHFTFYAMQRIGIDCRLYHQTGVGVYIRNLIYYLQKIAPENIEFYLYFLSSPVNHLRLTNNAFKIKIVNARWHSLNEQIGFYRQLMTDNLDL